MLKYLIILISFLFVSCDVLDHSDKIAEQNLNNNISVNRKFTQDDSSAVFKDYPTNRNIKLEEPFYISQPPQIDHSRLPIHSPINLNTSKRLRDLYFPGFTFDSKYVVDNYHILEDCSDISQYWCKTRYFFDSYSNIVFDYNQDDKLDLIAFLTNSSESAIYGTSNTWIKGPGKLMFIDDYLGKETKNYIEIEEFLSGVWFFLNDFNNDGIMDVLLTNLSGHHGVPEQFIDRNYPMNIMFFDQDGNYTMKEIPHETAYFGVETGDIDNDGDIDIVLGEGRTDINTSPHGHNSMLFFINDGNGNFEVSHRIKESDYFKDTWPGFEMTATAVDLFDLNNDGCLDLFFGWSYNQANKEQHPNLLYDLNVMRILWGDCSGYYTFENSFIIPLNDVSVPYVNHMGQETRMFSGISEVNFLDYDLDGDYDLLFVYEIGTNGTFLEMWRNDDLSDFVNVTSEVFERSKFYEDDGVMSETHDDQIPPFKNVTIYDMDNDGDLDIIPRKFVDSPTNKWSTGYEYFQNNGGRFRFTQLK